MKRLLRPNPSTPAVILTKVRIQCKERKTVRLALDNGSVQGLPLWILNQVQDDEVL